MGERPLGESRIAEGPYAGDLERTPGRDLHRLIGPLQLHFGDHQRRVFRLEHIQNPVATR